MTSMSPYQRNLIFPDQVLLNELSNGQLRTGCRFAYNFACRVISPKHLHNALSSSMTYLAPSLITATASVALLVIFSVGAAGHCSSYLLGGGAIAVGSSIFLLNGFFSVRHIKSENPFLKTAAQESIAKGWIQGGACLALGIAVLTGSTSAILGGKIGLGIAFGAPLVALCVNRYVLPKLSKSFKEAHQEVWIEVYCSAIQYLFEATTACLFHPNDIPTIARKELMINLLNQLSKRLPYTREQLTTELTRRFESQLKQNNLSDDERQSVTRAKNFFSNFMSRNNGQSQEQRFVSLAITN